MSRLLWVLAGFVAGVVVSRNAAPMASPVLGAVLVGVALVVAVAWWGGVRDKKAAVATAVAKAVAVATATAEAQSAAVAGAAAQAAVNLYLGGAGVGPDGQADASDLSPRRLAGRHEAVPMLDGVLVRDAASSLMGESTVHEVPQVT